MNEVMTKEKFDLLEVNPTDCGWYHVTLFQFKKEKDEHPDYIKDWLYFDGFRWEYIGEYQGNCLVCFIHEKE